MNKLRLQSQRPVSQLGLGLGFSLGLELGFRVRVFYIYINWFITFCKKTLIIYQGMACENNFSVKVMNQYLRGFPFFKTT